MWPFQNEPMDKMKILQDVKVTRHLSYKTFKVRDMCNTTAKVPKLGTNGLIRDQRYRTDHDAGIPMPD